MSTATRLVVCAVLGCAGVSAHAEIEASVDLRVVSSDGRNSYLDGGLGKLRYDGDDDGLQLGRARLAWRDGIGGNWHASVDLSAWSTDDHNAIDITEGWLEWRPVPKSAWRSNVKIGAFYAPISLEHRASGWTNPYTISSSALNTWIGEEFRTIGVGYELDHMGIAAGGRFDWGVNAAVFGWNDPAGIIIALRGFSLNDRQTPLFGRIGTFAYGGREQRVIFSEIDNRPGYHVGAYMKTDTGIEARTLHYDNRGDPTVQKPSISDWAWKTRFDSLGLRWDGQRGTAVIAQWLAGDTRATPNEQYTWNYDTWFVLAAQTWRRHRFAVRYDNFTTEQDKEYLTGPGTYDSGHAWTIGWTWSAHDHVEVSAEWLRIDSLHSTRTLLGESPRAIEHSLQMAVRVAL